MHIVYAIAPDVKRLVGALQVTMEAEVTNKGALALYGNLGFIRSKRLHRYYLNGVDAYRLKLLFPRPPDPSNLLIGDVGGYDTGHYQPHNCSEHDHHHQHDHQHCGGHDHVHSSLCH